MPTAAVAVSMAITTETGVTDSSVDLRLLKLMHLVSPALPIGAYAYSQGLEHAVECNWVHDITTAADWFSAVMRESMAQLDLPIMRRIHAALLGEDIGQLQYWNRYLLASRETFELHQEDTQLGLALKRLLAAIAPESITLLNTQEEHAFGCVFTLAAAHWEIDLELLVEGFLWSWLENQVAAATKLIPLGQTDAQRLLTLLMPEIRTAVDYSRAVQDEHLGGSLPLLALGSALHETQYSRLFRS